MIAYRIAEAAEACAVSEKRIRKAVKDGELIPSYPDSQPRFSRAELEDWVASWSREPVEG